jgi:L-ascorbate metabolism protein UlaG (beta-lactamase superfamily)
MRRGVTRRVLLSGGASLAAAPAVFYAIDPFGGPRYRGPVSGHFDGARFQNLAPFPFHGFGDFVRWRRTARPGYWPEWIDSKPGPRPPARVDGLRVTLVNHSTVLVQTGGVNILTDPVWSERASPLSWAGPQRHRAPGLRFDDLPPIDVVLVSHNHYDHLDLATLKRLAARGARDFFAPLGDGPLLKSRGIPRVAELDWWQSALAGGARITAVPAQHFSGRGLRDRNATLWCGYIIESAAGAVYFAGDTGWGPHFALIRERWPAIRLALLPVGAYRPAWFMSPVHLSPDDAVRAHAALGAFLSVPIHYGTFALGDDSAREPLDDLARALATHGDARFRVLEFGEGWDVAGPQATPG